VWTTSTEFYPEKAYSPAAVYAMLNHGGDYSAAAKALIKDGYGVKLTPETERKAKENPLVFENKFWSVSDRGKIKVKTLDLIELIHSKGGFSLYKYNDESEAIIVQLKDGIVKRCDVGDIKQFVVNYVRKEINADCFDGGLTVNDLLNTIIEDCDAFISNRYLQYLEPLRVEFLKDTADKAFFPFENGVLEVTADGCTFRNYGSFGKVIWSNQKISRELTYLGDDYFTDKDSKDSVMFFKYLQCVTGGNFDKLSYFMSALGYLLHKHKDAKRPFAIILAEECENDENGGGTGKSLFAKAVAELLAMESFDGKKFDTGKSFAFQRVSPSTRLLNIDDANRNFNFEALNTIITDGLIVEQKNKGEYKIPFEDSPKVIISTNYSISDDSNHAKRRQKVLEFSPFFSPEHSPFDEFGVMLFTDWDGDEWNRFYNFMAFCCRLYLETGILSSQQSDTNKLKSIKEKYGDDFLVFIRDFAETNKSFIVNGDIYSRFVENYKVDAKKYTNQKFGKGLSYAAKLLGYNYEAKVERVGGVPQRMVRISKGKIEIQDEAF
jgi:hypothetical protein